ncbi:MAG TPA: ribosome maturation factor RimM [Bauldia sp.]|nr:ribosome maturation factor RimM [Bauldia sp.]
MADPAFVLVARIGAAHGLRGEVRLKAMTADPMAVLSYGDLASADGRRFSVAAARFAAGSSSPDMLVVRLKDVADRTAAEALNGTDLYVPRSRLPAPAEDEFYHADLVGLAAATPSGNELGTVIAVHNHGAGDILEIAPRRGETLLVPFTRAVVPEVDIAGRRIVVDPPPGLLDSDEGGQTEDSR